jgi:hypothetical protein
MENLDRVLIAVMIVIVVIVGIAVLVPQTRGVAYRVRNGLSAAVYESGSYSVPVQTTYVQNPYYTQPWYYSNSTGKTSSTVTTYSTTQPQYYTYTTTPTYTYSPDTVMCGANLPCSVYWSQYPQYQYSNSNYPYYYNY